MFLFLILMSYIACIIFNTIMIFYDFRKNYSTISVKDLFLFSLFGIIFPWILTIIYIQEFCDDIKDKRFKNPFYKGVR